MDHGAIFFIYLFLRQQNILNKSCRECFFRHLLILWFFVDQNFLPGDGGWFVIFQIFKGIVLRQLTVFGNFNCYWFWQRTLLRALKKSIYYENWARDMYFNVCVCLSSQKWQKMKFLTFQAQPVWVRVISSSILYVNVVLENFNDKNGNLGSK